MRKVEQGMLFDAINTLISLLPEANEVSDGFHTFGELYQHRIALWIKLCHYEHLFGRKVVWRSEYHSDGSGIEGWFILGMGTEPGEQITYHVPMCEWTRSDFAEVLPRAPEFDGHSPTDVVERIEAL